MKKCAQKAVHNNLLNAYSGATETPMAAYLTPIKSCFCFVNKNRLELYEICHTVHS